MSKLSIVGVSGNLHRPSRTAALVARVLGRLERRFASPAQHIELVDVAPALFRGFSSDTLDAEGRAALATVENADLLVVASPVYKGSYTGALKHLFDLVDRDALVGKPVILAATGGSALHGLVPDHLLRPLFAFFRAFATPTSLFLTDAELKANALDSAEFIARVNRAVEEAARALASTPPAPKAVSAAAL